MTELTDVIAPIRVLLVDDQELLRVGFRLVLEAQPDIEVVGEASDGREAITKVSELDPDVVLMDVRMPVLDGIHATERIVARFPRTRVLVLTTFDLDEYAFGGLRAGASGFLLKDVPPAQLLAAIRAVAAGDAAVSSRVTRAMLELFAGQLPLPGGTEEAAVPPGSGAGDPGTPAIVGDPSAASGIPSSLTEREAEVFVALAEGLANAEIAERLFVSESTVKTHVGRVLAKLGARDRIHAVIMAYELGIARPPTS